MDNKELDIQEVNNNVVEESKLSLELFFIERLRQIMEDRSLSRYKLGKITGITQASLSTIMSGKCAPSLATIDKLCKGLGISVSDFFNMAGDKPYILSTEEREALRYWNELDKSQKKMAIAFAQGLVAQAKANKL